MRKLWLLFSQVVTIVLACWFVVATLQPDWLRAIGLHLSRQPGSAAASASALLTSSPSETLRNAAKVAAPAVVSVITNPEQAEQLVQQQRGDGQKDRSESEEEDSFSGMGSGVIVSPDGYILTNNHVLEEATAIEIQLSDGRRAPATVIGTDPDTDLAVLKISLGTVPSVALGDSGSLQVGDPVLAIGNPFGVGQTVTSGIVSALGRSELGINTFENFIQTDAAINPGNSGGALVDIRGNLVGINTAIYSRTGGYMGIGFATPTSMAKQVLDDIIHTGHVTRGWIGVEPSNITAEIAAAFGGKENEGVMVTGILHDSPASKAGLQPGDIISKVNAQNIRNAQDLLAAVSALKPGVIADLAVKRKSEIRTIKITPQQRPKPAASSENVGGQ